MDSCSLADGSSASQYARESPHHATAIRSSARTAATNVHEGGSTGSPNERATAIVSVFAAVHAVDIAVCHSVSREANDPLGRGVPVSTAHASFEAARLARSLSGAVVTPSHTTRTANEVSAVDARAIASSLRAWMMPLSQTPPTQSLGDSVQWSRGDCCLAPHTVQKPSSAIDEPHSTHDAGVAPLRPGTTRCVRGTSSASVDEATVPSTTVTALSRSLPHASQNTSPAATGAAQV